MSGTESTPRPRPLESAKITDTHRSKLAVVCVRQSTPQQVVENRESLDRQYALADHAPALGRPAERVLVGPQGDRPRPHRAGDRDDPRGRRAGDGPHRVDRRDRDGAHPAATDQLLQAARRLRADAAACGVRRRGRPDRGGDRRDPQSGGLPPALRSRGPLHAGAGPGPGVPAGPQPEAAARRGAWWPTNGGSATWRTSSAWDTADSRNGSGGTMSMPDASGAGSIC